MKITPKVSIPLLASMITSSLSANEFTTREYGVNQISPAQRYSQNTGSEGQVSMSKDEFNITNKVSSSKSEFDVTKTKMEAVGQYNLPMNVFTGIGVELGQDKLDRTSPAEDSQTTQQSLKPFVGININPNLAIAYQFEHRQSKTEDANTISTNQHQVGVVYHNESFELGGSFQNKIDDEETQKPSTIAIHGQTKVSDKLKLGALIKQSQYSDLDSDHDDVTQVKVFSQYKPNDKWDFEGAVAFQGSGDNKQGQVSPEKAEKFSTEIGSYYQIRENIQLGSAVKYERLTSSTDLQELDANSMALALQARFNF